MDDISGRSLALGVDHYIDVGDGFVERHGPKVVPLGVHLICRDCTDYVLWAIRANKWPMMVLWIYSDVVYDGFVYAVSGTWFMERAACET